MRRAVRARQNLPEKHLRDLVRKIFIDVNLAAAPLDLLSQPANPFVHTCSFPSEVPSEVQEMQLFYDR